MFSAYYEFGNNVYKVEKHYTMSRSRKKSPVHAITNAASDKAFKKLEHRKARRARKALDLTEEDPIGERMFGDPWRSCKDGKSRFDPEVHPDLMRK